MTRKRPATSGELLSGCGCFALMLVGAAFAVYLGLKLASLVLGPITSAF